MSNKHFGIGAKGYYIALILSAAAIGITSYLYYHNANHVREASVQETQTAELVIGTQPVQAAATMPSTAPKPRVETTAPTQASVPQGLKTAAPVSGSTIGSFAVDCLSYNETTRDWRTHNGIDLAAPEGAEVTAAADGTVYTTYEDDNLGHTVVIRHQGGYTTRYSNLREDLCVSAGDTVELGQPIGYVGCSALVETAMDSHVHFSVSFQDDPMSPEEFLAMG